MSKNKNQYASQIARFFLIVLAALSGAGAGQTYYVAPNGSPDNPGTESKPWPDLTYAAAHVTAGDTICVRQGVWRQQQCFCDYQQSRSGTQDQPIRVVNYPNETPCFYGSKQFTDPAQWTSAGESVWRTADQSIVGYDVGCIWHDDLPSQQKHSKSELTKPWDFWFDAANKCVYVFCATNPAANAKSIEIPVANQWQHTFQLHGVHHLIIEGLTIKYTNTHGIAMSDVDHVTIRNCKVSHGGGAWIWEGQNVRYGNAIELFGSGHDILVEGCDISHYFDSGITNQGDRGEQYNITYRRNRLHHVKCALEFWASGTMNVHDICYEDNTIETTGDNWAGNLQNVWGAIRLMRLHPNGINKDQPVKGVVERFVVRRNVISDCGSQTGGMSAVESLFYEHPSIRVIGGPFFIEQNTIKRGRSEGIFVSDDFHGTIQNNTISDCAWSGIRVKDSPRATIKDNAVTGCGQTPAAEK